MKWIKWNEGKEKKEVELTIHKRVEDHFTLKYGVLGINTRSISSGAQYVTLDSKIKCLSLAVYLLAIPPIKLKLELHIRWGLLIAKHLDQSLWSTNQKYWAAVMCNLLHSLWRCTTMLRDVPATAVRTNLVQKNQFPELNRNMLTFSQYIAVSGVKCWALSEML